MHRVIPSTDVYWASSGNDKRISWVPNQCVLSLCLLSLLLLSIGKSSFHSVLKDVKPYKVSVYHHDELSQDSIPKRNYEWHFFVNHQYWWFIHHNMNVIDLVFKLLVFLTGDCAWLTHGYRKIPWSTLSK